jgi:hypothetical protein
MKVYDANVGMTMLDIGTRWSGQPHVSSALCP